MAVLNLPPGMMGPAGPPMGPMGGPMGQPGPVGPGGLPPALASVLMPKQMGFPVRPHLRIPKPPHKKLRGKLSPATKIAVKAKAARAMANF